MTGRNHLNTKPLRDYELERRWLSLALFISGLSLAASAQRVPEVSLPDAPSAVMLRADAVSDALFPAQTEVREPDHPQASNPQDSDRNFMGMVKRGVRDQEEIYRAPLRRQNLKWDVLFLATTGGLIAADKRISGTISHDHVSVSQRVSDVGLYSTMAATGVLYLSGIVNKDDHARETGVLGLEALGNTFIVVAATQLIAGRERPAEGAGHGRFWVNNAFNSSFPSQHSGLTWSMASVLAHEYPRPWVQILAYGTATTVSVTRVTGLRHFPADVAVGGIFGYFIGQHIFHAHSYFFRGRFQPLRSGPDYALDQVDSRKFDSRPSASRVIAH